MARIAWLRLLQEPGHQDWQGAELGILFDDAEHLSEEMHWHADHLEDTGP